MQVEVIIQQGRAMLAKPIYLKPTAPSHVFVEINDDLVEPTRDWFPETKLIPIAGKEQVPAASHSPTQARFNAILGPLARERAGSSIGDDHQMLLDALDERHGGR